MNEENVSDSMFNVTFEVSDNPTDYEQEGTRGVQVRLTGNVVPLNADGWMNSPNGGLVRTDGLHQACQPEFWSKVVGTDVLMQFVGNPKSVVNIIDKISGSSYSVPYQEIKRLFMERTQSYEPKEISDVLLTLKRSE